jgi:hypothetical protein
MMIALIVTYGKLRNTLLYVNYIHPWYVNILLTLNGVCTVDNALIAAMHSQDGFA